MLCVSAAPRSGSRMNRIAMVQRMPGIPATKNAERQPYSLATVPLTAKLRATPTGSPSIKIARAFARQPAGKRSPINDVAAGAHDASPTPTPSRIAKICQKFCAKPEAAVSRLQTKTPADSIPLRPILSAKTPSGTPTKA